MKPNRTPRLPLYLPTLAGTGLIALTAAWIALLPATSAEAQQAPVTGSVYQNQASSVSASGPENVMIILDSSYSMGEPLGGRRGNTNKMVAAKQAVLDVLKSLPAETRVGLRVYGNSANQFTACRATDTLVPLGENNRNLIASKMIGIRPTGATPISYAVERSLGEDFGQVAGRKSIILISDGMETCGEDPCNVAVRMQQKGIDVKINVIGYGLNDYAATKQLRCVALATKGQFYTANTAAELANSLNKALAVETKVEGTILTPLDSPPPANGETFQQTYTTQPPEPQIPAKVFEDKLLPAAVPIKPNTR